MEEAAATGTTLNEGRKTYAKETKAFWYLLCDMFHKSKAKYKNQMSTFLDHEDSGEYVSNTSQFRKKISRHYKDYREGTLTDDCIGTDQKEIRRKESKYHLVEEALADRLERMRDAGQPLPPKSGKRLIALNIARELGKGESFKATYPWLNKTLKRRKIVCEPTTEDLKVAALVPTATRVGVDDDTVSTMTQLHTPIEAVNIENDEDWSAADHDFGVYTDAEIMRQLNLLTDCVDNENDADFLADYDFGMYNDAEILQYFSTDAAKHFEYTADNPSTQSLLPRKYKETQTLLGHPSNVECCTVWNDGQYLLSGSVDRTLKVWERASDGHYHSIQTLEGHSHPVRCCAVWNDGQHLLSGSEDCTLKVWERTSDCQYHCIQTLEGHSDRVCCCAVWDGGQHLLSGSWDNTLKVWEHSGDGQYHFIQTLEGHSHFVGCCAMWNDGQYLLSGSYDETLKVWERANDGQYYHCIQTLMGHSHWVQCCAVWNDGQHLLSGSTDKTLKVWGRANDGQYHCIQTLKGHSSFVECCAVWNDGQHLLSGSRDKTLKLWERASDGQYRCIHTLAGHSEMVACCAVLSDGRHLLSGSWDETLKVWSLEAGQEDETEYGSGGTVA